ncbi:MAG: sulfite exporter TauE/SafE family protein, partial [Schleiferiaceae bacterium]|nr:sulfite exporter TauE/SafE family protein [Schleiferiaceae bacterium]
YLALMALFLFPPEVMKPTALLLNIFVAGVSFYAFYRNGHFNWKLFYPFAIASIPFAFIGGYLEIEPSLYKKILGGVLVFAVLRMLGVFGKEKANLNTMPVWQGLIAGALIGLFSGMIGIGGGIILSPLILIMGWGRMKETAAVSALFIFVNSIAGMSGYLMNGSSIEPQAFLLVGVALIGGFAGAMFGSGRLNNLQLRYMLALVLVVASVKLFMV